MGDRGNIFVRDDILAKALDSSAGRGRANDAPYLTRIIFDTMTEGQHGEETGFGISASLGDGNGTVLVVDPRLQRVVIADEGAENKPVSPEDGSSYDDFIKEHLA